MVNSARKHHIFIQHGLQSISVPNYKIYGIHYNKYRKVIAKRLILKTYKQLINNKATIITFRTIWENARALYFEQANWLVILVWWTQKIFIELCKEFIYCIVQWKKPTSLLRIWIRKKKRLNILCVLFLDLYENALNWWVWITVAWKIFTKTLVMSSSFF